jgi:hypothetical protein
LDICKISPESFESFENEKSRSTDPEMPKDIPKDTLDDKSAISFETVPENPTQNQELKGVKDSKDIPQCYYENLNIVGISSSKTYICQWCRILLNRIVCYQASDFLEKHTVAKHPGLTAYPGPVDIQKFEREQKEKQQPEREKVNE